MYLLAVNPSQWGCVQNNVSSDPHQWEMMIPKDFAVLFSKSTVMRFAHQGHAIIIIIIIR